MVRKVLPSLPCRGRRRWGGYENEEQSGGKVYREISTVYTLKGVGGDILICEEAAYMDLGVFYEVVVPILEMEEACIIFITTPLGSFNFHSAFGQLRDAKGRKVINCVKVGLICKRCRESDHPEQCPHMKGRRPAWKSEAKFNDLIKVLMADQLTLLRREAMGEIADDGELAFQPAKVNLALNEDAQRGEQEVISAYSPPVLFLSVDPTGEGSSKFAIHTDYYKGNRQYVRLSLSFIFLFYGFFCTVCV